MARCAYCGKQKCGCGADFFVKKRVGKPPVSFKPSTSPSSAPSVIVFWAFAFLMCGMAPSFGVLLVIGGTLFLAMAVISNKTLLSDQLIFASIGIGGLFVLIGVIWGFNAAMTTFWGSSLDAGRLAMESLR